MNSTKLFAAAACMGPLAGCVPMMAAQAVSAVAMTARGEQVGNQALRPIALQECSARASTYGTVHIIDVEQRSTSRMIVWGTVDDGKAKRSFQCDFGKQITGFTLRPIVQPGA